MNIVTTEGYCVVAILNAVLASCLLLLRFSKHARMDRDINIIGKINATFKVTRSLKSSLIINVVKNKGKI